jgi:hypothetical protein
LYSAALALFGAGDEDVRASLRFNTKGFALTEDVDDDR